ncbi:hypothetical protein M2275_008211 [Rhodococcus opacus]|nr:hypothetical protein [Rhodococcus opacus]
MARLGEVRKGRGRKPSIPQAKIDEIVDLTQNYRPKGETHWSCRTMAEVVGVSKDTVQRVWFARGLKPHRVETFKLSNDPRVEDKLVDVVGLDLNPPERAIVLCADEKSSVRGSRSGRNRRRSMPFECAGCQEILLESLNSDLFRYEGEHYPTADVPRLEPS